jgi:hypothetical protein
MCKIHYLFHRRNTLMKKISVIKYITKKTGFD